MSSIADRFKADGVVVIRQAVSRKHVDKILTLVEGLIEAPSKHGANVTAPGNPGMFFQDRNLCRQDKAFADLARELPLAGLAAEALGSNVIRIFYDQVFVKDPGTKENFVWHQDRPYWNVDGTQICSTWLALTSADSASSALEFVVGSHRWGKTFRPEFPGLEGKTPEQLEKILWRGVGDYVRSFPEFCPEFEKYPDRYEIRSYAVEPGDVLLFDYRTVHRSGPNAGRLRRAAISWRWLGDDARWAPKPGADPIVKPEDTDMRSGDLIADDALFPVIFPADSFG